MIFLRLVTSAVALVAHTVLAAKIIVLLFESVNVYEYQGVRAVDLIAGFSVISIFACASAEETAPIAVAVLRAVLRRHKVDVFI